MNAFAFVAIFVPLWASRIPATGANEWRSGAAYQHSERHRIDTGEQTRKPPLSDLNTENTKAVIKSVLLFRRIVIPDGAAISRCEIARLINETSFENGLPKELASRFVGPSGLACPVSYALRPPRTPHWAVVRITRSSSTTIVLEANVQGPFSNFHIETYRLRIAASAAQKASYNVKSLTITARSLGFS